MRRFIDSSEFHAAVVAAVVLLCMGCVASLFTQDWHTLLLSLAIAAACILVGALVAGVHGRPRQRPHWQCPACGYDRRGLPPKAPCPECGPPTSKSPTH